MQFFLGLLQLGDVGVDRHRAAVIGFMLTDLNPARVAALVQVLAAWRAVARDSRCHPRIGIAFHLVDIAAVHRLAHHGLKRRIRLDPSLAAGIEQFLEPVVPHHQAVAGVEQ